MAKKLTLGSLNKVGGDDTRTDDLLSGDDAAGEQAHRGQPLARRAQAKPADTPQADATATPVEVPAIADAQSASDLVAILDADKPEQTPEEEEAAKLATITSAEQLDAPLTGDATAATAATAAAAPGSKPAASTPNPFTSAMQAKLGTSGKAKRATPRAAAPDPEAQFDSMNALLQDANLQASTPARSAPGRARANTGATAQQVEDAENAKSAQSARAQQGPGAGAAVTGPGGVGAELLGRAIATPFLALSSAYRHLKVASKQLGLDAESLPAPASRAEPELNLPATPHISGQRITSWKLSRIESSQNRVIEAADALRGTDEFMVWDEKLQSIAHERKMGIEQIVQTMTTDPELLPLKEEMDAIWEKHPTLVGAYQDACNGFNNHLEDVTKVFATSPVDVRERVSAAMANVVDNTTNMPGFGDDLGEYRRTMAERVREKLEAMMKFLSRLLERVAGMSQSGSELAP